MDVLRFVLPPLALLFLLLSSCSYSSPSELTRPGTVAPSVPRQPVAAGEAQGTQTLAQLHSLRHSHPLPPFVCSLSTREPRSFACVLDSPRFLCAVLRIFDQKQL
jgi:hypothetical protein